MEMIGSANGKRLLCGIAGQVKEPAKLAQLRSAPSSDWFSNEALVAEHYQIVDEALVSQVLAGS